MAGGVTVGVPIIGAGGMAGGMAGSVAGVIAAIVTGVVVVGVAVAVAVGLENSVNKGQPSWAARGVGGGLVAANLFLIWFSLLGGYQLF